MSRCQRCGGRGYIDGFMRFGMGLKPALEQCPVRCNISGYSREVQRRLSALKREEDLDSTPVDQAPWGPCVVLPFRGADTTKS